MKTMKLTRAEQKIEAELETVLDRDFLTPTRRRHYEEAARQAVAAREKKAARVNLRMSAADVAGLKAQASELGLPYQTLAVAVLHQVATGKLRLDFIEN